MLKAAILGCGRIAGAYCYGAADGGAVLTHIQAYRANPAMGPIAICDPDAAARDRFGEVFGIDSRYASVAELLAAEQPDIVSLCTPPHTHQALLAQCVDARVPAVWAEKPEGDDPAQVAAILTQAKANGTRVLFNYPRSFDVLSEQVRHIAADRPYGGLERAVVHYSRSLWHNGGHPLDLLLHWLGPVVERRVLAVHEGTDAGSLRFDALLRFRNAPSAPVYLLSNAGEPANFFEYTLHFHTAYVRSTFNGMGGAIHHAVPNPRFSGRMYFSDTGEPLASDFPEVMHKMLAALTGSLQSGRWEPFNSEAALANLALRKSLIDEALAHV